MATSTKQFSDTHVYHFLDLGTRRATYMQGHLDKMFSRWDDERDPATSEDHARWLQLGEVEDHEAHVIIPPDKAREAIIQSGAFPKNLLELETFIAPYRAESEKPLEMPMPLPHVDGTEMTAREIFQEPAHEVDLYTVRRFLPVFDSLDYESLNHLEDEACRLMGQKVQCWEVADYDYDGRRFWELTTVTYEGKPVMICQRAGREGDDHQRAFIVDGELFKKANEHIFSLAKFTYEHDTGDCVFVDMDEVREDMHAFYNASLSQIREAKIHKAQERELQKQIAKEHPELHGKACFAAMSGEIIYSDENEYKVHEYLRFNNIKVVRGENTVLGIHEWMAK